MLTIDTHYHASESWFEPIEVLLFHMARAGVDKAVLAQHREEWDNRYIIECSRRFPGRFAAIGAIDVTQPDAAETLEHWAAEGLEGVRFWATERSPGPDPLAIWRKTAELGLLVSCPGTTGEYASDDFQSLVEELRDLPIVLEHLAILENLTHGAKGVPQPPYTAFKKALSLSRFPNTYLKITGLGEIMPRPSPARTPPFDLDKVPPYIDMAIEAFGADRLMIGTDPTSSSREGYLNVWRYLHEYLARRSVAEQEAIFGKTADRLFRFSAEPKR